MNENELRKVPELLVCAVQIPAEDKISYVWFPSKEILECRLDNNFLRQIGKGGYFISVFVWDVNKMVTTGMLCSVVSHKPFNDKKSVVKLICKARVKFQRSDKNSDGYKLYTWTFVPDVQLDKKDYPDAAFLIADISLNFNYFVLGEALFCSDIETRLKIIESAHVNYANNLIEKIHNSPDGPDLLGETMDAIMNALNFITKGIYYHSLIIVDESDVFERTKAVHDLLVFLNSVRDGASAKSNSKSLVSKSSDNIINVVDLVNALLNDEIVNEQFDSSGSSEQNDPPSICEMRDFISRRVVGQERAVKTITRAFNLAKAGYFVKDRPLLKFIAAGPTSVGKTETAYALADFMWQKEKEAVERARTKGTVAHISMEEIDVLPLVSVDCGMFAGSLSHGISNLIGSPSGYVGSKGAGRQYGYQEPILTPKNFPPNRIIILLFDEIEKAIFESRSNGSEILGILMKILDKGEFVNNDGDKVDFKRTVIIFTSNLAARDIVNAAKGGSIGFISEIRRSWLSDKEVKSLNKEIFAATRREYYEKFPSEFRNRIDRLVVFRFLNMEHYLKIIKKELVDVLAWGKERGFEIELSDEATNWILEEINSEEGVRKLRDFITSKIMEPIANLYNLGRLKNAKRLFIKTKTVMEEDSEKVKADIIIKK